MWRCPRKIEGGVWMGRLGGCVYDIIDVFMRRRRDENMGCKMLKVILYVHIRKIANRSIDENDEL